jgi:hypothetical protein
MIMPCIVIDSTSPITYETRLLGLQTGDDSAAAFAPWYQSAGPPQTAAGNSNDLWSVSRENSPAACNRWGANASRQLGAVGGEFTTCLD